MKNTNTNTNANVNTNITLTNLADNRLENLRNEICSYYQIIIDNASLQEQRKQKLAPFAKKVSELEKIVEKNGTNKEDLQKATEAYESKKAELKEWYEKEKKTFTKSDNIKALEKLINAYSVGGNSLQAVENRIKKWFADTYKFNLDGKAGKNIFKNIHQSESIAKLIKTNGMECTTYKGATVTRAIFIALYEYGTKAGVIKPVTIPQILKEKNNRKNSAVTVTKIRKERKRG